MDERHRTETVLVAGYRHNVHVYIASEACAPTIIALHGFTGSGKDFQLLRESMGVDRWSWICPDFMGHGKSDCPVVIDPYCLESVLRMIDQARHLVATGSKVHLLGYSMGGRLAMQYYSRVGDLPTAVIGATPGIEDRVERRQRRENDGRLIRMLQHEGLKAFVRAWEDQPLIAPQTQIPEPWRTALSVRRRKNRPEGLVHSLLGCGSGVLPSLWTRLDSLSGLHCLAGCGDAKFLKIAQRMHLDDSSISVHPVGECGHAAHLENPEKTAAVLESIFCR